MRQEKRDHNIYGIRVERGKGYGEKVRWDADGPQRAVIYWQISSVSP